MDCFVMLFGCSRQTERGVALAQGEENIDHDDEQPFNYVL
jgi:hypothetical protein